MTLTPPRSHRPLASDRGFAVLVLLVLLSIMLLLVAGNTRTVNLLRQELKLVEKRQVERLAIGATNRPPAGVNTTKPPLKP
ncbi:MAG: hypothetical protein ACYDH9_20770 [Limisphaerales bacterium]